MFGLLDIKSCTLKKQTKKFYACNVCNAIASKYGRSSRLMLTNDAVYLSMLIAAQRPSSNPISFPQCRPWSRKALPAPEFDYPATVSLLTSGVNLVDDIADEKSVQSKLLHLYYQKKIKKAEENLRAFGISIPSIKKLVELQRIREGKTGKNVEYYAKVTEDIYSTIFANTALLADTPCNYQYLANVGRNVGRIAYLIDGYMDFEHDQKKNTFNVYNNCNDFYPENGTDHKRFFNQTIHEGLQKVRDNISKIDLYQYGDTIRYAVTDGLQARIQNILQGKGVWLKQPHIYFAFIPIFFILAQIDGGDGCCDICDPGAVNCYLWGPSGSATGQVGASAAQGAIGAAAGGIGGAAVAHAVSKTAETTAGAASAKTVTPTDVKMKSLPDYIPEPSGRSSSWYKIDEINRIKSRIPPGTPDNFPILSYELFWLKTDLNKPGMPEGEKKILKNLIKESQENIKFDLRQTQELANRRISIFEEADEIWNNKPAMVDKYYSDLATYYNSPIMYEAIMREAPDGLAYEIEDKLAKSPKSEEREWFEKFKSLNRRRMRFNKRTQPRKGEKIRFFGPNDAKAYASVTSTRA